MEAHEEWRRLQQMYAQLADSELLRLVAAREGLTPEAQTALDGEMRSRQLSLPDETEGPVVDAELTLPSAADDPSQVLLWYFAAAYEAWQAGELLRGAGIDFRLEAPHRQPANTPVLSDEIELGKTARYAAKDTSFGLQALPGVNLFIGRAQQSEAVALLRQAMGLFPQAEHDGASVEAADADEEPFFPAAEFETEADFVIAEAALTTAGIVFRSEGLGLDVRFDDLDRAAEVLQWALSG